MSVENLIKNISELLIILRKEVQHYGFRNSNARA